MFYLDKLHGKTVMKTDILEGLTHYFTTRECPIKSKEPEMQSIVEENRKMFCEELGVTPENFIYPEQRHTDNHEQAVFLNFADCTPLIAYDKKQNIGAVIHAGWKGTVGRIGTKTILKMMDDFDTDIRDVRVAIGPAISVCCYEVKEDVFNMSMVSVKNNKGLYEIKDGKIYVNLKEINKRQLEEIGVKYIDVCPYRYY